MKTISSSRTGAAAAHQAKPLPAEPSAEGEALPLGRGDSTWGSLLQGEATAIRRERGGGAGGQGGGAVVRREDVGVGDRGPGGQFGPPRRMPSYHDSDGFVEDMRREDGLADPKQIALTATAPPVPASPTTGRLADDLRLQTAVRFSDGRCWKVTAILPLLLIPFLLLLLLRRSRYVRKYGVPALSVCSHYYFC